MKISVDKGVTLEVCGDDVAVVDLLSSKVNAKGRQDKDDAFFVCDVGDIIKKFLKFQLCLPRVEAFYAVKCNSDPVVVKLLGKLGLGFDCASKTELQQVLSYGFQPDKVIFANPCKQPSHIRYAASMGVTMMTFDNEVELHKIKELYPDAELVIRIRVDDSKALCQLGTKFGVSPCHAKKLLQTAKALDLNVIGVSFHVGSGCYDSSLYYDAVGSAKFIFEEAEEIGYHFTFLDVGGGFPGDNNAQVSFEETADQLNRGFDKFFPPSSGVRIIAEPGRYFVSSAFTIACNVISKRVVHCDASQKNEDGFMYYINDGVYGSFNCIFFDHKHPKAKPLVPPEGNKYYKSSIWGPTCDSIDCISKDEMLPQLNVGDWVYFENMGAYTLAAASNFNGFCRPIVRYIVRSSYYTYIADFWPRVYARKKKKSVFHEEAISSLSLATAGAVF